VALIVIAVLSSSGVGVTYVCGDSGGNSPGYDLAQIPQSVVDHATRLAQELFGNHRHKGEQLISQLLAMYSAVKDRDLVIIFNCGGWGYTRLEAANGWSTIHDGIEQELAQRGYRSIWLGHQRTAHSLRGYLSVFREEIAGGSLKARDLAARVRFLIGSLPDIRVILTGESNGTVIVERVMELLGDNPRVYSIQTGPPFWHGSRERERSLVITDNGITPDTFTRGAFWAIIWENLRTFFGVRKPRDQGTIFYYVLAPGHDYWWRYPRVRSQIIGFLDGHFVAS